MLKYIAAAAILVGLYQWTSRFSPADAAVGITFLAAASLIIVLGLAR